LTPKGANSKEDFRCNGHVALGWQFCTCFHKGVIRTTTFHRNQDGRNIRQTEQNKILVKS
jgi:hypothetical protein